MVLDDYTVLTPKWLDGALDLQLLAASIFAVKLAWHLYTYNIQGNCKYNIVSYYSPTCIIILWLVVSFLWLLT